jgi:hypothetical protein
VPRFQRVVEFQRAKYCEFLEKYRVSPKWSESSFERYSVCYEAGNPLWKKIQDEKARAKMRMDLHTDDELDKSY